MDARRIATPGRRPPTRTPSPSPSRLFRSPMASLVAVALLVLAGCGNDRNVACGGADTARTDPPPPTLGDFPRHTRQTTGFPLYGTRPANSQVAIDSTRFVAATCHTRWATTVDLRPGINFFSLVTVSDGGNRSAATTVTITVDVLPPPAPTISGLPAGNTTTQGTALLTGTRESGARVVLNGHTLVPAGPGAAFSAQVALPVVGNNDLTFSQVDAAGNETPVADRITHTLVRTGTPGTPVRLNTPLNRERTAGRFDLPGVVPLIWNGVPAFGGNYRVQVARTPAFVAVAPDPGLVFDDVTTGLLVNLTPPQPGTYYWRVGTEVAGEVTYGQARAFRFGNAPADVNGDGLTDVIAGAPGSDGGRGVASADNRGRVDLFPGRTTLGRDAAGARILESTALRYEGLEPGGEMGLSVAIGDVNGDGFGDVLAGAHRADTTFKNAGMAHLFLGGINPDAVVDMTLQGDEFDDNLGVAVSSGFDLNADGIDDFAVGAWQYDAPGTSLADNRGRAYIFFGGSPLPDLVPDLVITGDEPRENVGSAFAGGFDFNGDGFDDLAVSGALADAPGTAGVIVDAGRVMVFYGGPNVDAVPDVILYGNVAGAHFGVSVSGAGDMDDDGYDELVVGSPAFRAGPTPSIGRVHVFRGGNPPQTNPATALQMQGQGANEAFGLLVTGGGDLNGDGLADMAVGIPFADAGASDPRFGDLGTVEIHYGARPLNGNSDARFTGEERADRLGFGLHITGDINGDGLHDMVFGAPNNDQASNLFGDTGRGYVLFGPGSVTALAATQNASTINNSNPAISIPGALLTSDGEKEGLGTAMW